jgi:hypothetical protein
MRRPSLLTQAEVRRAVKAAFQAGAAEVEVRPDGKIIVKREPSTGPAQALEDTGEIVL